MKFPWLYDGAVEGALLFFFGLGRVLWEAYVYLLKDHVDVIKKPCKLVEWLERETGGWHWDKEGCATF